MIREDCSGCSCHINPPCSHCVGECHCSKHAICVGCGRSAEDLKEYTEDNPVTDDGTYKNGKFVCTECYVKLIPLGLDIGEPEVVQANALRAIGVRK